MSSGNLPTMNPQDIMQLIQQESPDQQIPVDAQGAMMDQMAAPQGMPMGPVTGMYDMGEPMTMASVNGLPIEKLMELLELLYGNQQGENIGTSPAADAQMGNMDALQQMIMQQQMMGGDPAAMAHMQNPSMSPYPYEEQMEGMFPDNEGVEPNHMMR